MANQMSRRSFGMAVASAGVLAALPLRSARAAADRAASPLDFVDPELRLAARQLLAGPPNDLSVEKLPALRTMAARFTSPPSPDVPVVEKLIAGAPGHPPVRIYIVNPAHGVKRPGVLHIHGGGFVFGSAKSSVRDLQKMAVDLGAVMISVEYRLAPETTYKGSIEDNYAALKWMYANAGEIGLDVKRIAVTGESAGGGHAALLAITARDRGEVPIFFQSLVYPMLDDRTGLTGRIPPYIGTLVWTKEQNRFGWRSFLGQEPGGRSVPKAAVPARSDVSGLPPAWIGVGSIDLFARENLAYATRLIEAGTATEMMVVPGAFHAFEVFAGTSSLATRFREARLNALKRAFAQAAS